MRLKIYDNVILSVDKLILNDYNLTVIYGGVNRCVISFWSKDTALFVYDKLFDEGKCDISVISDRVQNIDMICRKEEIIEQLDKGTVGVLVVSNGEPDEESKIVNNTHYIVPSERLREVKEEIREVKNGN